jgi:hypothetical protein
MKATPGDPAPGCRATAVPGFVVHDHHVVAFQGNPKFCRCDIHGEMLYEVGFRPECQTADSGVNAIGPDHHVKVAWSSPVEDHIDATIVRVNLGDYLVEKKLGISAAGLDQDRAEMCPRHLNLAIFALPSPHARHAPAGIVDEDQLAHLGRGVLQARHDTKPLRNLVRTSTDIHWITARSDALIAFDSGYFVSCPTEQCRQRCTGDSGA